MNQRSLPRPMTPPGDDPVSTLPPAPSGEAAFFPPNLWQGFAAAPGRVRGPATVVRQGRTEPVPAVGTIVVCPVLSRSLLADHPEALAFVAEGGGALSLAAAQAREAGVPAVVGLDRATATVHDGDLLEVDGSEGVIRILARALPRP